MKREPFQITFREHVPLAPYTTLGTGGPARFLADAGTESDVLRALEFAAAQHLPVFVLGGGSNLVVSDAGFPGLVIRIALRGIETKQSGEVVAAAGEDWDALVRICVEQNLAGIECLSGIPGTVGGTPVQNVGAYGQEVSDTIVSVRSLDREDLATVTLKSHECRFAYRTSIFNSSHRNRYVILSVSYALRPGGEPRIAYPDLARQFASRPDRPSLAEVREAVLRVRKTKSMVLLPGNPDARSAGSFFKNPVVSSGTSTEIEEAARRRALLPGGASMPRHPQPEGTVKLSAAWLIEHAGFSAGYVRGRVGISSRHALALINRGGATTQELIDLMRDIQSAVRECFGVELIPEPVFVGFEN